MSDNETGHLRVVEFPDLNSLEQKKCRKMYERAASKDGVVAGACVTVFRDGRIATEYVTGRNYFTLLGAIEFIKKRITSGD